MTQDDEALQRAVFAQRWPSVEHDGCISLLIFLPFLYILAAMPSAAMVQVRFFFLTCGAQTTLESLIGRKGNPIFLFVWLDLPNNVSRVLGNTKMGMKNTPRARVLSKWKRSKLCGAFLLILLDVSCSFLNIFRELVYKSLVLSAWEAPDNSAHEWPVCII